MKQYIVRVHDDRIEWYNQEGQRHREDDLPAIEWKGGDKTYWIKGQLHRGGDLPAVEGSNGNKEYWVNGQLHRDGGLPAIECPNGTKEYWVNGKKVAKRQAEKLAKPSYNGKIVKINCKKYQLKKL
jgi:hypothetical protein